MYSATHIYPLATARGKKFLCELCKKNAYHHMPEM